MAPRQDAYLTTRNSSGRTAGGATRQGGYLAELLGNGASGDGQLNGAKFTELHRKMEHKNFAGGELGTIRFCSSHPICPCPRVGLRRSPKQHSF
jgi:hypothetical protein